MPATHVAPLVAAWQKSHRGLAAPSRPSGAAPATVTFPTTRLVTRVLIALGADPAASPATWQWADITRYVRQDLGISLSVGRPDESGTVQYGRATLKLDNRDGRFTRRNPTSPYFGLLSMNTPIWVTVDAGSGEKTRIEMFVNEWPARWTDKSGNDSTVTIQCSGVLRRLAQGGLARSPLMAGLGATNPTAWWPLEGGSPVSGLVGGTSMTQIGQVQYATQSGQAGSADLPDFTGGGSLVAPLPNTATTNQWRLECVCRFGTGSDTINDAQFTVPVHVVSPNGTVNVWEFLVSAGTAIVQWSDTAGVYFDLLDSGLAVDDGQWHHLRLDAAQSGSDIVVTFTVDGTTTVTSTLAGKTLNSTDSRVYVNPNQEVAAYVGSVGHLVYWAPFVSTTDTSYIATGYKGETAHVRIARLCAEGGIPLVGLASISAAMGPQPVGTVLDIIREAEAADGGVLYEKHWGLAYKSLAEFYNQPVGLALDFARGHIADIPEPADDDQRVRNKWTVSRPSGSEYTAEQTTGPMGTGAQGPGTYADSATVNVETDAQLASQASWRVHVGTVDEDRWPGLGLNFARTPALVDSWADLPYGARVTIAHPVSQMPPGDIDAIVEGYSERWDPYQWVALLNTSPNSPYRIFRLAETTGDLNPFKGYLTPASCVLAADLDTTSVSVTITSSTLWSTAADDWTPPPTITIEGEDMTVSAVAGSSNPQTLTVARSANGVVKAHAAGVAVAFKSPGVLGL